MYRISIVLLFISVALSSCSRSEDNATDALKPHITIVTSVDGLGDMGYNDLIMNGIMHFYEANDVVMNLIQPNSIEGIGQALYEWISETKEKGKSLLVLEGNECEGLVATKEIKLSANQQILLFESKNKNLPEGVATFNINRYGASYLAGCMAKEHCSATIIAARPRDSTIEESIHGFADGYETHGNGSVEVVYLSENDEGFAMADSAYRVASKIYNAFIFPLAGGSNNGIYKYSRESSFHLPLIVGMDVDCAIYSDRIPFSMVVHIDKVVEQYLSDWVNNLPMPKHRTFGLKSGIIDIALSKVFYQNLDVWEDYYADDDYWINAYQKHKEEAINKEEEYEGN